MAAQGVPQLAQDAGAALVEREVRAHRLSGDQLLRGAQAAPQAREPGPGRSQAGRNVREAGDPDRGAEAAGGRRGGRGVRLGIGRHHVSGDTRPAGDHLLCDLRSDPRAPGLGPQVPRIGGSTQRQLLRGLELCGVHGRLVRLHPQGRALPARALHVFPDQCVVDRTVRAHAHRRRRRELRQLPRGMLRAGPGRESAARGRGGARGARRRHDQVLDHPELVPGGRGRPRGDLQLRHQARRVPRQELEDLLDAGGDRLGDHLEVSRLHPPGRQLDRRVLLGGRDEPAPAGGHRHEDDPHGEEHALDHRVQGHLGGSRAEHLSRPREDSQGRRARAQLLAVRLDANRRPVRGAHLSVHRRAQQHGDHGARGVDVEDRRGPDLLCEAARVVGGGRRLDDRQRVLQGSLQRAADGVRRRGAAPPRDQSRGERRMTGKGKRQRGNVLLEIRDLHATVEGREILRGIDLTVRAGEVHAIMGPNGSGKSTLAQVLAGHPAYTVTAGSASYEDKDLLAMTPEARAREGVFLAFQYPVAIRGITNAYFLRSAVNAIRKHRGEEELGPVEFMDALEEKLKVIGWDSSYLTRPVNEGFSGGEKKRNEILQLAVLDPKLAILDETDSGLDIDALKTVARTVDKLRRPDNATVLVTHYYRILTHIEPDVVHVLAGGRIVKSGGKELALELEEKGYDWLREEAVVA